MIKKDSIDRVKDAVVLSQVMEACGVELKRNGKHIKACCPFHNEKTPSLSIDDSNGKYKCFGCGEGGDAINFLIKHKGLEFADAVEWLADVFKVQLEYEKDNAESKAKRTEDEKLYDVMNEVKTIYQAELKKNKAALDYLLIDRGLDMNTIYEWEFGFAPANWRTLSDYFIKNAKWDLAVKAGVCKENGEKNHDMFYNRIMIPIHNEKGQCVSFSGRIWTKEQKERDEAKYVNGPATGIYEKDKTLFGLNKTVSFIKQEDEGILLEGNLDVVMAWQNGIKNTVASCGTAVSKEHAELLLKKTKNIVLAGDNDKAGVKSIMKSVDLFLELGANKLDVLEWPEGVKDLDEYFKQYKL